MANTRTDTLSPFQWALLEIRTDIESRKLEGDVTDEQELAIVMNALALINEIHADREDLDRAQALFWESANLPLEQRTKKLWEAIDVFIQ